MIVIHTRHKCTYAGAVVLPWLHVHLLDRKTEREQLNLVSFSSVFWGQKCWTTTGTTEKWKLAATPCRTGHFQHVTVITAKGIYDAGSLPLSLSGQHIFLGVYSNRHLPLCYCYLNGRWHIFFNVFILYFLTNMNPSVLIGMAKEVMSFYITRTHKFFFLSVMRIILCPNYDIRMVF